MAYYLKYRPQRFAELDNREAREALIRIFKSGKIPHAFLLAGPKGIGKTSAARIIAKSLNCLHPKEKGFEPCNSCSICSAINKGNFLDILEIDAASNRGIDNIRDLKEKIKLSPSRGSYKVYIIDEVHMLTTEAFNALLKTLEEPPPKVVFILCTTNPEKLPETIVSRCTRINFKKASEEELVSSLQKVVRGEKLLVDKKVLEKIALFADGSFRDAQKVLEELSLLNKEITQRDVDQIVGRQQAYSPTFLVKILEKGTLLEAIAEAERVAKGGVDILDYTKCLLEELRFYLHGVWGLVNGKESDFKENEILDYIQIFSHAVVEMKMAALPILSLEVAIGRIMGKKGGENGKRVKKFAIKKVAAISEENKDGDIGLGKDKKVNDKQWREVLDRVRPQNHSVEAFLKAAYPIGLVGSVLKLGVYYQFHKECLEKEVNRRIVERAASDVFGLPIKVFCEISSKKQPERKVSEEQDLMAVAKTIFGGEKNV
ncbi:DNA polymerase III, subunit gamma and tau [Candidatus Shapirobacteria bacterium CG09_land_8_20_14_0_10_38_17]|uniref:DNA polymerase III subunit gamma/tau n=1 Tax=Candidatus Shapirobacteria bacterium CG09_land_8_20_14_0_10_38_17 TaxID=1974884 RepID=A0A2H0WT29_9BACT|nr:MAG: DNA polymerase III, subunit gamma and tau [Candidatus Shapirobacteria bacterium CG09_land_8_20_14_0_10_38_17]